jgi:glycosyltransferase involved in cell wall biosynthesis
MNIAPKNPKISVIIPCYNYGRFVKEAVESVLEQTFRDFEIIIIDDGSDDPDTISVLRKIEDQHPEIKIIRQQNGGPAKARNRGIERSRGEFFLPLDADDTIEPEMLEECYQEISKDPKFGMVYTWVHFFGNDEAIWKNGEYNFFDMLHTNQVTVSALVRKYAWEEVGGYDEDMRDGYEDWEFWIRLGKAGWFGKLIRESLFNYRRHGTSITSGSELKHDKIVKYILEKHKDLFSKESLKKIKKTWKTEGSGGLCKNLGAKLRGAGLADAELWKKHPMRAAGRIIPIRIKRKVNVIFQKRIFDTSYYKRSE